MSLLLWKIPLLLSSAVAIHISFTPPTPPPAPEEAVKATGTEVFTARMILAIPYVCKCFFWFASISETLLILAAHHPSPLSRLLLALLAGSPALTPSTVPLSVSPLYLVGFVGAISGSLFRLLAFRALGRHFTFTISLRKDHALVKTGPYAVVRHPSYTGSLLSVLGSIACLLAPGAWLPACAFPRSWLLTSATAALVGVQAVVLAGVVARVPKEDALLRATFGREWEEWAARTRFRLVPGVY